MRVDKSKFFGSIFSENSQSLKISTFDTPKKCSSKNYKMIFSVEFCGESDTKITLDPPRFSIFEGIRLLQKAPLKMMLFMRRIRILCDNFS